MKAATRARSRGKRAMAKVNVVREPERGMLAALGGAA
jgi:hypothetical protein